MKRYLPAYGLLVLANILFFVLPGLRVITAGLLIFTSGIGWTSLLLNDEGWLGKMNLMLGLSVSTTMLAVLGLQYLPGPVYTWHLLLVLNLFAFTPLLWLRRQPDTPLAQGRLPLLFVFVLIIAMLLRFVNLDYSEFQGDEALAMIIAAEAIEGHEDALFLRGKGPGEILLPLAVWRIKGTITELDARVPFMVAGIGAILSLYLIGKALFDLNTAMSSALLLASSGFMVGFSRIVQYQMLVVWMSGLAFWALWQWRESGLRRWGFISGLFVGVGLLAHYDAILVLPVLGWIFLHQIWTSSKAIQRLVIGPKLVQTVGLWLLGFLGSATPFYVPYLLDPQIAGTRDYLGTRFGETFPSNNIAVFFHFHSFYSSFYYVLVMGLLLLGFVTLVLKSAFANQRGLGMAFGLGAASILAIVSLWPDLLGVWTSIPFTIILVGIVCYPGLSLAQRLALIWFAVPFIGYNFAVARPLTHIYTVLPGWALLAGWTFTQLRWPQPVKVGVQLVVVLVFSGYLWTAFVSHRVEFLTDYPTTRPAGYWSPYEKSPDTGFFGFPHRSGWKAVGALVADGTLTGDYDSNEEEDITSWYTRHQPRACDPGAEFYYVSNNPFDEVLITNDPWGQVYQPVGKLKLGGQRETFIHHLTPTKLNLGDLDEPSLALQFDQTATPAAFTRTPQWQVDQPTNFAGQIQLLGYTLDQRRAYPGGRLILTLYWQLITETSESYKVFAQLDPNRKFAQADGYPACGRYQTNLWRPGQIIADRHALYISPETPLESIPLAIGLYQPESGLMLDYLDVAGNPAGVILPLTQIEIVETVGLD